MTDHLILIGKPTTEALHPLALRLEALGYTLSVASSADDALQLLQNRSPGAVLIDVAAPEVNGIPACRTIRQATNHDLVIIGLNQGEPTLKQAALDAGADLVMDEPVNWVDLRAWLKTPRAANGHLLAEGPLFGQTQADVIGAASLLAHDLKSPISVIISSLEVMLAFQEEEGISEMNRRLLQGALGAAYRQLNLVSALVDLPRLELNCYDLQLAQCDLTEVVRESLAKEAHTLEVKGLNLKVDLSSGPLHVKADHDLLQRVVTALVDNTIKFTVRGDDLCISTVREGQDAVLRFTDSGRPIQPGFEGDILRRAPQWERRQSGARTSVALGLPFVHAVAQAHGGHFSAASDGKHTTFKFSLPAL